MSLVKGLKLRNIETLKNKTGFARFIYSTINGFWLNYELISWIRTKAKGHNQISILFFFRTKPGLS